MASQSFSSSVATPGTPQRLTDGAAPAMASLSGALSGTITPQGSYIVVTADPANTPGKTLYIGSSQLNVTTGAGWSERLAPGATVVLANMGGCGSVDSGNYWVDTDGTVAKYGVEVVS